MQSVNLTAELVNAILGYLGSKPFNEVAQLINAIQNQAVPQINQVAPQVTQEAEPANTPVVS